MMKLALAALLIGLVACGDDGPPIVVPDAGPDAQAACDPRAQTGCRTGEKCATRVLQLMPELTDIACVPDGAVAIDGACMYKSPAEGGYSDCRAGGECVNDVCKQVCDHQGGTPRCDANHACGTYEGILSSNNMTVAGVCDPKCDPLTQALLVGTNTAACGSTNAAMADTGCFTFDQIDFTCARIPTQARNLTDRMRALAPGLGSAYVNGCAAGYLPLLFEMSGSMAVICSGICAPKKLDTVNNTNPTGDPAVLVKLHNEAAPAAGNGVCEVNRKGSAPDAENCHYMWRFNIMNNAIVPSPYNDTTGACFAYPKYMVTINGQSLGFPSCQQLPPAGTPADPVMFPYGNANEWPCVPSAEVGFTADKKLKVNPALSDVKIGGPVGPAVRHILRQ
jgi:hypothetical protein